jgi:hypothetical protein
MGSLWVRCGGEAVQVRLTDRQRGCHDTATQTAVALVSVLMGAPRNDTQASMSSATLSSAATGMWLTRVILPSLLMSSTRRFHSSGA